MSQISYGYTSKFYDTYIKLIYLRSNFGVGRRPTPNKHVTLRGKMKIYFIPKAYNTPMAKW